MSGSDLQGRTQQAIEQLRDMRCSDPAADDALDAIKLAAYTLEHWWLPELARRG